MRLEGKRVVIIGGSSGIGLETARLALAEGALVTIAGRSEDRLRRAADSVLSGGDRVRSVVADLSDRIVDPVAVRRGGPCRSRLRAGRGTPARGGRPAEV